jgi:hypothetical protein
MAKESARQRLLASEPPWVATLEPAKAARFKAKTMLIPSAGQIRDEIAKILPGQSKSLRTIREELAASAGADITCPGAAGKHWRLAAEAAEEDRAEGATDITPWWRVTRDGQPHRWLPGGEERHRALLAAEGVSI